MRAPNLTYLSRELDDVREFIVRRRDRARSNRTFVARPDDFLPALRSRIDAEINALGTPDEEAVLGEDGLLALIADLVEYRLALWSESIPFELVAGLLDEQPVGEVPPPFVIKHQGTDVKETQQ
jgi:hypothetical protein